MIISLNNVCLSYATTNVETKALDNISLEIAEGEFVAITGPSGCGKSTLLNVIGLLDEPTDGTIEIFGSQIGRFSERTRTHHRRQNIGFIFQGFNLIPERTLSENVAVGLKYRNIPKKEHKERIIDAIENVGLLHRANHYPSQLSGGQQQRTAIARAMVGRPALILADEPTGNLDSTNSDEIMELMTTLVKDGASLVMVTHSQTQAASADKVVFMRDGGIH